MPEHFDISASRIRRAQENELTSRDLDFVERDLFAWTDIGLDASNAILAAAFDLPADTSEWASMNVFRDEESGEWVVFVTLDDGTEVAVEYGADDQNARDNIFGPGGLYAVAVIEGVPVEREIGS